MMKFEKTHVLIAAFILFWIVFIGWGMLKTTFKLTKDKPVGQVAARRAAEPKAAPKKEAAPKSAPKEQAPKPAEVQVETRAVLVRALRIKTTDFQDILPVMGTVKGKTEIELKFEVSGIIKNIVFREGEKIKKGDMIACLDPKDMLLRVAYSKNKLNAAQAAYNSIQKKSEVHKKLYEAGAILKTKLEEVELECESAKYQVETTRNELELVENELNKTCIYAPKNGVMGPRKKEEGEFVTPQDKTGSLLEIGEVLVEVGVVERDIDKVKLGQKANIYVDAYPNIVFEGKVDSIFPIVEGKSRTLTIKIKVPNPDGLLFPGMFSRAEIMIITLKDAFVVPSTCLVSGGKGITLLPVIPEGSVKTAEDGTETGIVELRRIKLGYLTSDYGQVLEGVAAEDLVVLEAQGELKDNAGVKIVGVEEMSF